MYSPPSINVTPIFLVYRGSKGGSFHFKAKLGALPLNFENVVFSMRDFTYVKFLQFFSLEKYLTFI